MRWFDALRKDGPLYLAVVLGFGMVSGGGYALGYRTALRIHPPQPGLTYDQTLPASDEKRTVVLPPARPDPDKDDACRRLRPESAKSPGPHPRVSTLVGHWSAIDASTELRSSELRSSSPGDVIRFERQRRPPHYIDHWPPSGLQFERNGRVAESINMGCSTESDPVTDHSESWSLVNSTLVIEGANRRVTAAVDVLDRRRLNLRVVEVCDFRAP